MALTSAGLASSEFTEAAPFLAQQDLPEEAEAPFAQQAAFSPLTPFALEQDAFSDGETFTNLPDLEQNSTSV